MTSRGLADSWRLANQHPNGCGSHQGGQMPGAKITFCSSVSGLWCLFCGTSLDFRLLSFVEFSWKGLVWIEGIDWNLGKGSCVYVFGYLCVAFSVHFWRACFVAHMGWWFHGWRYGYQMVLPSLSFTFHCQGGSSERLLLYVKLM